MSEIKSEQIFETIKKLCLIANTKLPKEDYLALKIKEIAKNYNL